MIEAARGNYDAIAWTPGAEQAKRFDLSKQIDDIRYAPSADGRTVSLEAYRGGENIFNHTNMPMEKLDAFVGKDVAERIAKGVGETDPNTGYRVLSGLDLQVGGEGMKGYYDKILPTQIGKVLKDINETPQFGTVNVPTPTRDARYHRLDDAELMAELGQNGDPPQSRSLPSLAITPAMREKINQGLPLFTMMPAAVGLGATASQMQEGQNPAAAEEQQGFADGGKIVRKALEAVRGLPKAVGLEEFMPAAGERRLPKAIGLEDFMRGAGERRLPSTPSIDGFMRGLPKAVDLENFMPERAPARLPSTPSIDEFMPAAERRLPEAVSLEDFMPAVREPRLPEAIGLEEFMPIDRAGGGKVVSDALEAIRRNRDNGGPVDMRAGEMIGLRARLGLSPKKITDRAGPIHTDPAVAARDAATVEAEPAVVEQALDVVRSQPAARPEPRALTVPAPRQAAPEPSESQRLWQLYNDSENPADFVRADEAMRAGRADGGRLLEDQYPTQYLPDVGRQVMQDGGAPEDFVSAQGRRRSTLEGLGGFEDRPVMDPEMMGQNWANAVARMKVEDYAKRPEGRSAPPRLPEQFVRPLDLDWRDKIGGAIAGDGGTVRGRVAKALVGNTGMPDTGMGFGLLDFTPFGAPLAASDVSTALKNEDYLGAALAPAGYAAYLARKPIGAAAKWTYENAIRPTYDAGRRAVDVAGDVLGRVPAPIAAGGAGAAAMTPEEAQAGKLDAAGRAVKSIFTPAPRAMTLKDVRRVFDPQAGAGMKPEEVERLVDAYGKVASPASSDPELANWGQKIAQSYITKGGSGYGGRSYFAQKPSVPLEKLGRAAEPIPYTHQLKPIVEKSWEDVGRERAGSPVISLGGDLSDLARLRAYGPVDNLRALANPTDIHAGFDYMREPNLHSVWSNNPEHAAMLEKAVLGQKDIQRAVKKDLPVMAVANPMGPRSIDSSKNMMDLYLSAVEGGAIPSESLKAATNIIRSGAFGDSPKAKEALRIKLANFPGFEDMDKARAFLLNNPDIVGTTRGAIIKGMERADLVKRGFPEVGQLRAAATSQKFMMAPGNMMGGRMVELDPRMFHQAEANRYFDHFTYGGDTPGQYYADVPLIHRQYGAPDATDMLLAKYNQYRPGATKKAPLKPPITAHPFSTDQSGRDTWRKMFEEQRMVQEINDRMMDSIRRGEAQRPLYGFKRGGSVSHRAMMLAKELGSSPRATV
jgi:hypothetical protein